MLIMKIAKLVTMIIIIAVLLSGSAYTDVTFAKDNGATFVSTDTEPIVGAPVQKIWTFEASKSGTYKIVFTYARSWEKDTPVSKTVEYKIKVTKKNGSKSEAVGLTEGKVNSIKRNQKFFITLEENPSTGYSWSYKASAKTIKLCKEETVKEKTVKEKTVN